MADSKQETKPLSAHILRSLWFLCGSSSRKMHHPWSLSCWRIPSSGGHKNSRLSLSVVILFMLPQTSLGPKQSETRQWQWQVSLLDRNGAKFLRALFDLATQFIHRMHDPCPFPPERKESTTCHAHPQGHFVEDEFFKISNVKLPQLYESLGDHKFTSNECRVPLQVSPYIFMTWKFSGKIIQCYWAYLAPHPYWRQHKLPSSSSSLKFSAWPAADASVCLA